MKRCIYSMAVGLVVVCLLFPTDAAAQQRAQKKVVPHKPVKIPWDLAVVDIIIEPSCRAVAVVRNVGTVALPDWAYGYQSSGKYVLLHVGKVGGSSTGVYLWACDSAKALQPPGGQITYAFAFLTDAPATLWGHIDPTDQLPEINETNNRLEKRFNGCPYLKPDLVVKSIRLVKGCNIEVTVKNQGQAGVPDSYYDLPDAVTVQLYKGTQPWGGMILKMFDPAGNLKTAGGSASKIWFPLAANLKLGPGSHSLRAVVDAGSVLSELSETNNTLTSTVYCRPIKRKK